MDGQNPSMDVQNPSMDVHPWMVRKQLSTDSWMKKCLSIHTMYTRYYSTMRRKESLPFVGTWVDVEGLMLSEMSDRGNIVYHLHEPSKQAEHTDKESGRPQGLRGVG